MPPHLFVDFEDGTPTMPRKASTTAEENGVSERVDAGSNLQSTATSGGSQSSLNSSATANSLPLDNAEQFESLKQKKETKEKGIQL